MDEEVNRALQRGARPVVVWLEVRQRWPDLSLERVFMAWLEHRKRRREAARGDLQRRADRRPGTSHD